MLNLTLLGHQEQCPGLLQSLGSLCHMLSDPSTLKALHILLSTSVFWYPWCSQGWVIFLKLKNNFSGRNINWINVKKNPAFYTSKHLMKIGREWGCQRHLFCTSGWRDIDCFHLCSAVCVFALNFGWSCLKSKNRNNNNKQPKKNFKELTMTLQCALYFTWIGFYLMMFMFGDFYVS